MLEYCRGFGKSRAGDVGRSLLEEQLWKCCHEEAAAEPEEQESPSPRELDLVPDKWGEFWDGEGGSSNAELCGHHLAAPNSFFGSRWLLLVSITAVIA